MAFGTFVMPDISGAFYQNSLLVQARGQLVLTVCMVSQEACPVNDSGRPAELYIPVPRDPSLQQYMRPGTTGLSMPLPKYQGMRRKQRVRCGIKILIR